MQQDQATMVAIIRQKLAMLRPEQRFAMGIGNAADSSKVMGATGLKDARKYQAMERLGATPAQIDSARAGLARPTDRKLSASELAGQRLVQSGNATQAQVDSVAAGIKRPTTGKTDKVSEKELGLRRMVERGELTESQADSVRTGLKGRPSATADRPDFNQAKSVYLAMYPKDMISGRPLDKKAPAFLDWFRNEWPAIRDNTQLPGKDSKFIGGGNTPRITSKATTGAKAPTKKKTIPGFYDTSR